MQCVLEVPTGSHVEEMATTVRVTHPTLGQWEHTPDPICLTPPYAPTPRPVRAVVADPGNQSCDEPPCTCDSLPCNNWIDTAGYMTGDRVIGGMSTVMTVPGTPTNGNGGGQTLFYFPGAENTDGTPRHGNPPPSGRAILQPVLTYGPLTNCQGSTPRSKTGWCIASWYCCPKGLTTHSTYLGDVAPGDKWLGLFNLTSPGADGTFEVVSQNTATGQKTSLSCPRQGRNFNWADITLEIYSVDTCSGLAIGPMTFSEIALWDERMSPISPEWLFTSKKPCGEKKPPSSLCSHRVTIICSYCRCHWHSRCADGEIKPADAKTITITHN
jgi:hypothetical protein